MSRFEEVPIHETEDYAIHVGPLPIGELQGETGYLLLNKRTGVIEGGVNVESAAIRILLSEQTALEAALLAQSGEEEIEDDVEFDKFIAKIKGEQESDS